jgi:urea transport system substrate-binding protein
MKRRTVVSGLAMAPLLGHLPSFAQAGPPIKIGIALDLTGPLASAGVPMLYAARATIDELNAAGGVLGRPIEAIVEDTASNESVGITKARKLVINDRVAAVFGGVTSSMRNAIKEPIAVRGHIPYFYPMPGDGLECTRDVYPTGPTPAHHCRPIVDYLNRTGAKRYYMLGSNYIYPRTINGTARKIVESTGGQVVGEDYFPLDQTDFSATVQKIMSQAPDVVFTHVIPPGIVSLFKQLGDAGFRSKGRLACVFMDEALVGLVPPADVEGTVSCLDYYASLNDELGNRINAAVLKSSGGKIAFTAGSGATGMYRALKLWSASATSAGSLERLALEKAVDKIGSLPGAGGPFEIEPGSRQLRLPMYIGVAKAGRFDVVERAGTIPGVAECKKA